jgi:uncharacterized membrane protein YhaH (DUF805 family)
MEKTPAAARRGQKRGIAMEYMFMPLKRYAEFSGRSRRMEYWMFVVFQFLIGIVFGVLAGIMGGLAMVGGGGPRAIMAMGGGIIILYLLYLLIMLVLFIPALAVGVRRLHDTNRSGWWIIAPLAAYIVMAIGLGIAAVSGSTGLAAIVSLLGGFAAVVLFITLLVFLFLDGTKGPNRYGPDPKGRADAQVFA